jgi:chromosome segregation ATPase
MRTACFTLALAWTLSASLPLAAQTLADVARQEAERRKALAATGKVLTNDDVRSQRPLTTAAALPEPAAPAAVGTAEDAERAGAAPVTPEEQARRLEELRRQVDRDHLAAEALRSRLNGLGYQIEQVSDAETRAMLEREREQISASLDELRAEIEKKEQALQQAEAPPGEAQGTTAPMNR